MDSQYVVLSVWLKQEKQSWWELKMEKGNYHIVHWRKSCFILRWFIIKEDSANFQSNLLLLHKHIAGVHFSIPCTYIYTHIIKFRKCNSMNGIYVINRPDPQNILIYVLPVVLTL